MPSVEYAPLAAAHDRSEFDCGSAEINLFLRQYARQQQEQGVSATTVAVEGKRILGYVTVCPCMLQGDTLSIKRLPRREVPALLLARMGVHADAGGTGIGRALVTRALSLAVTMRETVGCVGVVLDPKEGRTSYYQRFGFLPLGISARFTACEPPMFMSIERIRQLLTPPSS